MDEIHEKRRFAEILNTDFLCERRLKELDPALHTCYRNSVFAMDMLLKNYKSVFPFFTNHTFEHSEQVINYCSLLAGAENIYRLNADEIYILLMGAGLHDVGLGVSESDYLAMKGSIPGLEAYVRANPEESAAVVTREFHNEFSAQFIRKYHDLFEIPTPEHIDCICAVAAGHRRKNLLDRSVFSPQYLLRDGTPVRILYLTALVRMADELDIAADRNLLFDYTKRDVHWSPVQTMCYRCHEAIKRLEARDDSIVLYYRTDDESVRQEILKMEEKVQRTFSMYSAVVHELADFELKYGSVRFIPF